MFGPIAPALRDPEARRAAVADTLPSVLRVCVRVKLPITVASTRIRAVLGTIGNLVAAKERCSGAGWVSRYPANPVDRSGCCQRHGGVEAESCRG
jgi:hypothetical protein